MPSSTMTSSSPMHDVVLVTSGRPTGRSAPARRRWPTSGKAQIHHLAWSPRFWSNPIESRTRGPMWSIFPCRAAGRRGRRWVLV